jgi:hypothetical protein
MDEEKLKKELDILENCICAGLDTGYGSSSTDIAFIRRRFADLKRLIGLIPPKQAPPNQRIDATHCYLCGKKFEEGITIQRDEVGWRHPKSDRRCVITEPRKVPEGYEGYEWVEGTPRVSFTGECQGFDGMDYGRPENPHSPVYLRKISKPHIPKPSEQAGDP